MGRTDAGAYSCFVSTRELRRERGVRDVRPGHRDHVEQPLADCVASRRKLGDAGGVKDREAHRLLEDAGEREKGRHRVRHPRHAVHRELHLGVHAAKDRVEEVDGPRCLEDPRYLEAFVEVQMPLPRLVDHETDSDDEVAADALADRFVHHQSKAAAVLHRTSESVASTVRRRREELPDEVGAGEGLDAIEPPFLAPRGGRCVVRHDPRNVVLVHLPCKGPVQGLAYRRGPDRRETGPRIRLTASAHVGQLAHEC